MAWPHSPGNYHAVLRGRTFMGKPLEVKPTNLITPQMLAPGKQDS